MNSSPDYRATLNLPKTSFPMKANLPQREPQWIEKWQRIGLYNRLRASRKNKEQFILHDGPPYANGRIHLGHVVNKVLKDLVNKTKLLSGFDVPYVPGWDCHGLPIELNIEKKFGKPGASISPKEFRAKAREFALSQVAIQKQDFQRLAVMGDWENPYLTMHQHTEASIVRSFGKMLEKGFIRLGRKPVHWCLDCRSALAEAEIEYQDKTSRAVDVAFSVDTSQAELEQLGERGKLLEGAAVVIWTTTTWTLPANEAVCLHPMSQYALIKTPEKSLLVAASLVAECLKRWEIDDYEEIASFTGQELLDAKLQLKHPYLDKKSLLISGEHVSEEAGTGFVHSAPAHGVEDFQAWSAHQLDVVDYVNEAGVYLSHVPHFAGQFIRKSEDGIREIIAEHGNLLSNYDFQHSYPHCWRHKSPTIFLSTQQVFVSLTPEFIQATQLQVKSSIKWYPSWGQERMLAMISSRPDWCISRERFWGVPIPLFFHKETKDMHPRSLEIIDKVAAAIEAGGLDAWFDSSEQDWLAEEADLYTKSRFTLDVWFDSGTTHESVLATRQDLRKPADMYLEGSDQHRGWFQSSLLTGMAIDSAPPYKSVLTHGFTVDEQGRKMSKSLGNVIAPETIIKEYGAEILRLWVASADYSKELNFSKTVLSSISDTYRKIRNTFRFLLSNLYDFDAVNHSISENQLNLIDKWVLHECVELQSKVETAYSQYQFMVAMQLVHRFCSETLGAYYLDIAKDRLYTSAVSGTARRSCQMVLEVLLHSLLRLVAPVLSFTAEEIWELLGHKDSSILEEEIFQHHFLKAYPQDYNQVKTLIGFKEEVAAQFENYRQAQQVSGSGLEFQIHIQPNTEHQETLARYQQELHFLLLVSKVKMVTDEEQLPYSTSFGTIDFSKASGQKCVRCWHHSDSVGSIAGHPEICQRCVSNIESEEGMVREFF